MALHLRNKNNSNDAVVLLDKKPFNSAVDWKTVLVSDHLKMTDSNDIYHRFIDTEKGIECKTIFPATAAHLKKYSEQSRRIISETPEMHQLITRPHYEMLRGTGQIDWIDNILADKSELERRIFDNKSPQTGFIILPDYKWVDEANLNEMYLLVIVRRQDLWSVRDLTGEHVELLKNIRKELCENIKRFKYPNGTSVLYDHLRVYVHYPPTYPHLHIHINLASSQASSCSAAQAILLDEIIDNLENVSPDYYKKMRTLSMDFGVQNDLYNKLKGKEEE